MNILAIDTSTALCGVALVINDESIGEYRLNRKNMHNEMLVHAIDSMVRDCAFELTHLDSIAISAGPGSFTGLRIGFSVAKGLAFALGKKIVPVNSLDVMAFAVKFWSDEICVVCKAREKEYYLATYQIAPHFHRTSSYEVIDAEGLLAKLPDRGLVVAAPELSQELAELGATQLAPPAFQLSSPLTLAQLAAQQLASGEAATVDPVSAEPFYLKDFQPKRKRSLFEVHAGT